MAAENALLPALDDLGAVLVAVSHQTTGLAEFQQKYFKRTEKAVHSVFPRSRVYRSTTNTRNFAN